MAKVKAVIPDNITEEYYQISMEIFSSFSKFRPPVDLYQFREDIKSLFPFSRKGQRLTNEQIEQSALLCAEGSLFVSRADHPIYSEHIVKQVDLVLVDRNIKESEATDIIIRALSMRYADFIDQPVLPVFEPLYKDLMVLTEYLWADKHRIRLLMRRLYTDKSDHVKHAVNTLIIGLWLFINAPSAFSRRSLDRTAIGLFLHDVGMSKIPLFIVQKKGPLKGEEIDKIKLHPLVGIKMLQRLNLGFDELSFAVMEHHERLDGSGYPQRAKEATLSSTGKITAIADSFSAMILQTPYKKQKTLKEAAQELADLKNQYETSYTKRLNAAILSGLFELSAEAKNFHGMEDEKDENEVESEADE